MAPCRASDALAPSLVPAGGGVQSFRLQGANFLRNSIIRWNGIPVAEGWQGFVSMQALDAAIPPAYLASGGEFQVSVETPAPGGGTSAALTFRISTFALDCGAPSATVDAGRSTTYSILLTPQYGSFDAPVSFVCDGLPKGSSATFSPPNMTPGAGTANVTLSVRTTAPAGSTAAMLTASGPMPPIVAGLAVFGLLAVLGGSVGRSRPLARGRWVTACALLALWLIASSCGAGGSGGHAGDGTPPGTYQISARATAGSLDVTLPLTLVVR